MAVNRVVGARRGRGVDDEVEDDAGAPSSHRKHQSTERSSMERADSVSRHGEVGGRGIDSERGDGGSATSAGEDRRGGN